MSTPLQNRLVGTVILVALAVIFLPDFLDGKKDSRAPLFDSVPRVPDKKPIVNPEPFPAERVERAAQRPIEIVEEEAIDNQFEEVNTLLIDDQATEVTKLREKEEQNVELERVPTTQDLQNQTVIERPETDQTSAGWVVQLGSFRHEKNVRLLLDKLEDAGYRSFSRPIQTQSGPLTKVFVGPDLQRNNLDASLDHLKELTGLNGKVTRFTITP